jgi:hypothetical protein
LHKNLQQENDGLFTRAEEYCGNGLLLEMLSEFGRVLKFSVAAIGRKHEVSQLFRLAQHFARADSAWA